MSACHLLSKNNPNNFGFKTFQRKPLMQPSFKMLWCYAIWLDSLLRAERDLSEGLQLCHVHHAEEEQSTCVDRSPYSVFR